MKNNKKDMAAKMEGRLKDIFPGHYVQVAPPLTLMGLTSGKLGVCIAERHTMYMGQGFMISAEEPKTAEGWMSFEERVIASAKAFYKL